MAARAEVLSLPVAAAKAPEGDAMDLWVDCQAVGSGFQNLIAIADDHNNFHAGSWRVIRMAIEENVYAVMKIKARRVCQDPPQQHPDQGAQGLSGCC
jgi:hypothetical protein